MGAKTSEDDFPEGNGRGPQSSQASSSGGEPRGTHLARDGDGSLGDGGDDDDDGDDDDGRWSRSESLTAEKGSKKKRKRKPRKKSGKAGQGKTSPPRLPLSDLFPAGIYPPGEPLSYSGHHDHPRVTDQERRHNAREHMKDPAFLNDYRRAAEVHRQVRYWARETIAPGQTLSEIATGIEDGVRALLDNQGLAPGESLRSGMGFPTGLSLNNGTAHYTPNPGQKEVVLQYQDVLKVDFGVHVNGWIVDSAFTLRFDPVYDNLLAAAKDATDSGIRAAGIDVRICDVSAAIQEAMESYEVEIRGKVHPVKAVRNICAHDIKHYRIHGGKSIPFIRNSDQTKMEEGEVFAIETFGTTGSGILRDDAGIYGYGLSSTAPRNVSLPFASANRLYRVIKEQFGTLVFCRRYLDRLGLDRYLAGLNCLVSNGILESYEPLADIAGSYSAQFEHTILLQETGKEVVSRGTDY